MVVTMKRLLYFALAFAMVGCTDEERTEPNKDMSLLACIVADNDLDDHADYVLNDLIKGLRSCPAGTEMVVYMDRQYQGPTINRYTMTTDGKVGMDKLAQYPERLSTDPEFFSEVLQTMRASVAGRKYGLIYWSHGTGWLPATTRAIGMDSGVSMDIDDFAECIENTEPAAFVLLDACLMGCAPVAYAMRNAADYMIASPAELPGVGFSYSSMLPYLAECTPQSLSKSLDMFIQSSSDNVYGDSATYAIASVTDCSQMDSLASSLHILLKEQRPFSADTIQTFDFDTEPMFFDLGAYARAAAKDTVSLKLFMEQLERTVIKEVHTPSIWSSDGLELVSKPVKEFCGLSTYIPGAGISYYDMVFSATSWYKAIE